MGIDSIASQLDEGYESSFVSQLAGESASSIQQQLALFRERIQETKEDASLGVNGTGGVKREQGLQESERVVWMATTVKQVSNLQ